VRTRGRHGEADLVGRRGEIAADPEDLGAQLLDVAANLGADFDDGLVQFALDLVAEDRGARGIDGGANIVA
jgi:hypothetical protein